MEKLIYWLHGTRSHPATAPWMWFGTWTCVLVMALVHLPVPLTGDQALYMYGAKAIAGGETLYLDFWDAKQPGVYLFYLLAGALFSFTEIGLHLMESIWFICAAWCAYRLGKSASPDGLAPLVIPVLTAGTYFASVQAWHMSQPDGLMAMPVVASIWAICDRQLLRRWAVRMAVAGFFAGVAAMFKISILLVPLMAALLSAFTHNAVSATQVRPSALALRLSLWFASAAIPFVLVGLWFWLEGALPELIWTTFLYPFTALIELDHHPLGLPDAAIWFVTMTMLWLPFAAVGAFWSLRQVLRGNESGVPGLLMILWGIVGGVTIFMQYHYWWAFHFNQFFIPVGVLAGVGLGVVFGLLNSKAPVTTVTILIAACIAAGVFSFRVSSKVSPLAEDLKSEGGLLSAYAERFNPASTHIIKSVTTALSGRPGGSLYVFGDPRFLLAAQRQQTVPHNGWALEIMTASQWERFAQAFESARPTYVYISSDYEDLLPKRAPQLHAWLHANYDVFSSDSLKGNWYGLVE